MIDLEVRESSLEYVTLIVTSQNIELMSGVEVQFDNKEFNGAVLKFDTDDNGIAYWDSWQSVSENDPLYKMAKNTAINYYCDKYK